MFAFIMNVAILSCLSTYHLDYLIYDSGCAGIYVYVASNDIIKVAAQHNSAFFFYQGRKK